MNSEKSNNSKKEIYINNASANLLSESENEANACGAYCCNGCSQAITAANGNKAQEDNAIASLISKHLLTIRFFTAAFLFALALLLELPAQFETAFYIVSYLIAGVDVIARAFQSVRKGFAFDENFLMTIATFGAFAIGEYPEGVAVMLFYQIGEYFQERSVKKSRNSIEAMMNIRPDYANVIEVDGTDRRQPPELVEPGMVIAVKPGERVPLDGVVLSGRSMLDTSALTGEAMPLEVSEGSVLLSGSINTGGLLKVKVTKSYSQSTVSRILELVKDASSRKSSTEKFITIFARYYTPAVVIAAALIAFIPPMFAGAASFSLWLNRALVFLVVSCPCALVVSIPLGFFGGIGGASRQGILIKGGNYLEALNHVDIVAFDKTGTLTAGEFFVEGLFPAEGTSREELLEYAALTESMSNHPVAKSIVRYYGKPLDKSVVLNYEEIPGRGIKAMINGQLVFAGNTKLFEQEADIFAPPYENINPGGTVVHLSKDGSYIGHIIVSDMIRKDSVEAIAALRKLGVRRIAMLTGDRREAALMVAKKLGINEVYSDLLPHEKVEIVEKLNREKKKGGKLVFAGDGINDAPVLARADIGVAMGAMGSDAAMEAADVVLMTDEPLKLISAVKIAKRTRSIVFQNITFAFGVKLLVLVLGAGGLASMWEAVFADVGVALLAVLNSIRAMQVTSK